MRLRDRLLEYLAGSSDGPRGDDHGIGGIQWSEALAASLFDRRRMEKGGRGDQIAIGRAMRRDVADREHCRDRRLCTGGFRPVQRDAMALSKY